MLEHAWYSVISPEGCAAILWKEANEKTNPKAAEALNLTAKDNKRLGIVDAIIKESLGGAHRDHEKTAENLRKWILDQLEELRPVRREVLPAKRYERYRNLGKFTEGGSE
jgi:acetyl-CoA carboxylase carboxyl transferase subunit alpha